MKYVRCNKCGNEYYICEELDKLGFPIGKLECEYCGETDYRVIEDDVKMEYSHIDDPITERREEFMCTILELKRDLSDLENNLGGVIKDLEEVISVYIDPWIK